MPGLLEFKPTFNCVDYIHLYCIEPLHLLKYKKIMRLFFLF